MKRKKSSSWDFFFPYIKPFRRRILGTWLLLLANILMQLPMPLLTMYLIDHVVARKNIPLLNLLCLGLFVFLFLQTSVSFFQRNLTIKIQNKVVTAVRVDFYNTLIHAKLNFFDKTKVGDVVTRITSDVGKLQGLFAEIIVSFLTDSLTLLVGTSILIVLHWKLALCSVAIIPFYLLSIKKFSSKLRTSNSTLQNHFSHLASCLFESFLGIYFMKSFGTEELESHRTGKAFQDLYHSKTKADTLNALAGVIASYISAIGRFILIWYGLTEIIAGGLTIGEFLAFNSFLRYIYDPSKNLMNLNTKLQQSLASLDRVHRFYQEAQANLEKDGSIELHDIKGKVVFKNVNFSYCPDRGTVLNNICFQVEPSWVVAIVGPNGSGKTTLMNLLLRLYKPDSGVIEIDDVNLSDLKNSCLRTQVGFVPQDMYLVSESIKYNIAYGNSNRSEEEIIAAAKMAEAHDFIEKLPESYHTIVGERGNKNLSGGEKQRLAIARSFLSRPKILIFDEATSSIDNESAFAIQKAMNILMKGKTTFVIAHRISTVIKSDLIIVLDKGRIVQTGNHRELIEQEGVYKILYEKEFDH